MDFIKQKTRKSISIRCEILARSHVDVDGHVCPACFHPHSNRDEISTALKRRYDVWYAQSYNILLKPRDQSTCVTRRARQIWAQTSPRASIGETMWLELMLNLGWATVHDLRLSGFRLCSMCWGRSLSPESAEGSACVLSSTLPNHKNTATQNGRKRLNSVCLLCKCLPAWLTGSPPDVSVWGAALRLLQLRKIPTALNKA